MPASAKRLVVQSSTASVVQVATAPYSTQCAQPMITTSAWLIPVGPVITSAPAASSAVPASQRASAAAGSILAATIASQVAPLTNAPAAPRGDGPSMPSLPATNALR